MLLKSRRWSAALYIAGYIFECALKALIVKNTTGEIEPALFTHDLGKLRRIALGYVEDSDAITLNSVPNWSVLQRYDCSEPTAREVLEFIRRVNEAHKCLIHYL